MNHPERVPVEHRAPLRRGLNWPWIAVGIILAGMAAALAFAIK